MFCKGAASVVIVVILQLEDGEALWVENVKWH